MIKDVIIYELTVGESLQIGNYMHRLDIQQLADFGCAASFGEFGRGPHIRPPGVRCADIDGEEFNEAFGRVLGRRKQRCQFHRARIDP
jgi:hypothetical protein